MEEFANVYSTLESIQYIIFEIQKDLLESKTTPEKVYENLTKEMISILHHIYVAKTTMNNPAASQVFH
ncbi:hypothetical protein [Halodesulfovibrio spirochaetisodalis]|uniref:Uncharacterized protein n=1 Tax=Halodesulfovibrio spirochaetisodalis TaxID=1560234 RepID=A0A1B7XMQ0_9BACT|nr:hypothetical protein [Halodesulfovibrio spirochaetisodalis]OBQ56786.1 hypothetical protein SP90_01535 [Halodesulfovibrio spirochaetisodalis]